MGPTLAATVYGLAAVFAAFLLRPKAAPTPALLRAAVFWMLSVPFLFLIQYTILSLVACGLLLLALAPRARSDRLAYYLLTLPAAPSAFAALVPFPGLNYLFTLDFPKIAFFVILAAPLLLAGRPAAARFVPSVGVLVIVLTLLYSVMAFRTENITNGLRLGVNHALTLALPYLGLIRLMDKEDMFEKAMASFLFLSCIFAFSALVSQATKWNFYDFLSTRAGEPAFADFRDGFLRVGVTLNPVLAGYAIGLGLIAVSYFRSLNRMKFLSAWIYRGLFAVALFFTYSRGAWLAVAAGLAAYIFFTKAPRGLRPAAISLGLVLGVPAAIIFALNADFSEIDAYGTFAYRQELLRATFVHIEMFPLFGDAAFYNRPHFAHLLQGQGIIDFVNRYVQVVVEYGLVGLAIFIAPYLIALAGLLGLPARDPSFWGSAAEHRRAAMIAVLGSYLVVIGTTSDVSYMRQYGIVVLALCAGFLGLVRGQQAARLRAEAGTRYAEGDLGRDGTPAPP